MKISELKDNWEQVRSATMTRYPFIVCVLIGRDIEVDGSVVTMKFYPEEKMIKNIATRYKGIINEVIKSYVDDEFTLNIKMENEDGEM